MEIALVTETGLNFGTPALRKKLKKFSKEYNRIFWLRDTIRRSVHTVNDRVDTIRRLPDFPAYPAEFAGMLCGAKTRKGTRCKNNTIYENGRCRFHGGLSTGPITKAGKLKAAKNGTRPKKHTTRPAEPIGGVSGYMSKPHGDIRQC